MKLRRGRREQRLVRHREPRNERDDLVEDLFQPTFDPVALVTEHVGTMPGDAKHQRHRHLGGRVERRRCGVSAKRVANHVHRLRPPCTTKANRNGGPPKTRA